MSKQSLVKFIDDKRAEGKTDSQITHTLLDAGWHIDIIHKVLHGEPIKSLGLEPVLAPKIEPKYKKIIAGVIIVFAVSILISLLFLIQS